MICHRLVLLYSYSYDITHTLQNNMSPPRNIIPTPSSQISMAGTGTLPENSTLGNQVMQIIFIFQSYFHQDWLLCNKAISILLFVPLNALVFVSVILYTFPHLVATHCSSGCHY